jgi:dihydrolipoamide dehydrogenase
VTVPLGVAPDPERGASEELRSDTVRLTGDPDASGSARLEQETGVASGKDKYDLTIIGSGPGGYVAAIRAAQLGLSTVVVEKAPKPGGTCLHWGCIPTKALLQAAEVYESALKGERFGVKASDVTLDMARVQKFKSKNVTVNARGVEFLFKKNGVALLSGRGKLAGAGRVEITPADQAPYTIETTHTVLATGSAVQSLPGIELDGKRVISSDEALGMREVPGSMIVLGAGAVGVEFASIYRSFGADVTLVELLPHLLPLEDESLGAELQKAFRKRGIECHTATRVEEVDTHDSGVRVSATREGETITMEAEVLLVAVGRRPVTEDLGLEGTGVRLDRGFVEVDPMMRTGEGGIYAIGDIVKTPALAHVASHEGIVAVEHAAGKNPVPIDYDKIPSCTYCDPEVAAIGLSEAEARKRGYDVVLGTFPFTAIGKAKILDDTRGFVKIVSERKHDEVLGVHIIGPHATELIAEATAALNLEATAESLFHAVHAHPTLAESLGEAALAVHGRAIHF